MIPVKVNGKKVLLPSRWGEVRLGDYLSLSGGSSLSDALQLFAGAAGEVLTDPALLSMMRWLYEPLSIEDFVPDAGVDLLRATYGQKIEACQLLEKDDTLASAEALIQIYYPEMECSSRPLDQVLPIYLGIVEQLQNILNTEKANLHVPPTAEQIRAGVSAFNELSYFNQIDDLAGGDPTKYDTILSLEYIVIYQKLRRNTISAIFEQRLSAVFKTGT